MKVRILLVLAVLVVFGAVSLVTQAHSAVQCSSGNAVAAQAALQNHTGDMKVTGIGRGGTCTYGSVISAANRTTVYTMMIQDFGGYGGMTVCSSAVKTVHYSDPNESKYWVINTVPQGNCVSGRHTWAQSQTTIYTSIGTSFNHFSPVVSQGAH